MKKVYISLFENNKSDSRIIFIKTVNFFMLFALALVGLILFLAFYYLSSEIHVNTYNLALTEARSHFNKDLQYRLWATTHGGVYVEPTAKYPANPNLSKVPDRDIETTNGRKLTLVNPAYMARQVNDIALERFNVVAHITSLNPIRKENRADEWETKALQLFDSNHKEAHSIEIVNGKRSFRFMSAMFTEKGCLKCHADQGYKLGDIRGGISVSLPYENYDKIAESQINKLIFWLIVFFIISSTIIIASRYIIILSYNKLISKDKEYKNILINMNEGYYRTNKDGHIIAGNPAFLKIVGFDRLLDLTNKQFIDFIENEKQKIEFIKLMEENNFINELEIALIDGKTNKKLVSVSNHYIFDKNNIIIGSEGIIRDISEKKQNEIKLIENERKYRHLSNILRSMCDNVPDMIWAKDLDKKYIFANKAICKDLLNAENTDEPIGKTDLFFAVRERESRPDNPQWHTFGEICADSDIITLQNGKPSRFEEFGNIKGVFTVLDVFKAPFYDYDNNLIGVVGSARDITLQKEAENKLKMSETSYVDLFNTITEAIYILDENMTFLAVNEGAAKMYGYSIEELIGKSPELVSAPNKNDLNFVVELLKSTFEDGIPRQFDFWGLRKNGDTFPKDVIASKGKYFGQDVLIVTARDISERYKTEEILKEKEERLRLSIEAGELGLYDLNVQTGKVITNERYALILGYQVKNFVETLDSWTNRLHPDDKERALTEYQNYILGKKREYNIEFRLKNKNGDYIWILSYGKIVEYDSNGSPLRMLGTHTDITHKKLAEEKLRQSEQDYKMLFEQAHDPIFIFKPEHEIIIEVNNRVSAVYGYTREELIGKSFEEITKNIQKGKEIIDLTLSSGEIIGYETIHLKKDGSEIILETNACKINYRGETAILSINRDITERKKFEIELLQAKNRAEQSDMLKTSFLQNMSHEIRTPLNGIVGFSSLLKDYDLISKEEALEYIDLILHSSERLLGIITDVLEISKLDSGSLKINYSNIYIEDLFNYLSKFFKPKAESKLLDFRVAIHKDVNNFFIYSDKNKILQIISNFLTNAIKFTENGYVELLSEIRDEFLIIEVNDSGIGIKQDYHEKIFERFWQYEALSKKTYGGTGLGLSISKGLANLLGMNILIKSQENVGSSFALEIPLNQTKLIDANKSNNNEQDVYDFNMKNFLIVEDEETNYLLLEKILKNSNVKITWAKTATQALKEIDNYSFDLALVDLKLPDIDGFELSKMIKAKNKSMPLIAQTAYALEEDSQKALAYGCDDFIAKPIDKRELLNKIAKLI